MKLSIIIVSYNTREVLKQCLLSLYNSLKRNLQANSQIIIIDNASADGSPEMVKEEFPEVLLVANKENVFFARANNQAASLATGEYLLLLNSDTIVEEGNLEKLIDFLDTHPIPIAAAGPLVLNADRSYQSYGYALPSMRERFFMCSKLHNLMPNRIVQKLCPGLPTKPLCRAVGWISGCCMLFRRDVYSQLGGLNPEVGFYGEEPEMGYRMSRHGYQTYVCPDATIIHLGGASSGGEIKRNLAQEEFRFQNYARLSNLTVGYSRAIRMSHLVIAIARLKKIIHQFYRRGNVPRLTESIAREKRLITFLKKCRSYEKSNH